ncbi:MAG: hypothetical protein ABEJ66_03475 [Candidatus Nanohaloarchaea archaeon]
MEISIKTLLSFLIGIVVLLVLTFMVNTRAAGAENFVLGLIP